jgi:hypothetical protein
MSGLSAPFSLVPARDPEAVGGSGRLGRVGAATLSGATGARRLHHALLLLAEDGIRASLLQQERGHHLNSTAQVPERRVL